MLSAAVIRRRFGDNICRRCINKKYHVQLEPVDCRYGYTHVCPCCKLSRNIVIGFTASGHAKMLFRF